MGWFDDSDDDEEEQPKPEFSNKAGQDSEGEDTLDAYMKSLESNASTTVTSHARAVRLDEENEDEATSHWVQKPKRKRPNDTDETSSSIEAANALDLTFHKAGKRTTAQPKMDKVQHEQAQYEAFVKDFWKASDSPQGHQWRVRNSVTCVPGTIDPIVEFAEIGSLLGEDFLSALTKKGYKNPTPVQSQTLSVALCGKDALVTAETGSGKTLAYVWPMAVHVCDQRVLEEGEGPIGLVLVPTRELALQVHKHVQAMLQPLKGKSVAITGGIGSYKVAQDFRKRGCEVVVATPGRFLDVLSVKKNGVSLKRTTFLVLDECDKMLEMGFEKQVTEILNGIRPDRQSLMLSATMGRKIERVAQRWLDEPVRISVGRTGQSSDHVEQHVMVLPSYEAKKQWLTEMVPVLAGVGRTLIFVATKGDCEVVAGVIRESHPSLVIETLHGDKHPSDRQSALKAFARGQLSALIATDVASRGLDVANVSTVINFDPAKNLDIHVHRVGRAGRLEKENQQHKKGVAYTLLTKKNADFANVLMNAFERENREVSVELRALAQRSRKAGNVAVRGRWNKAGLGFSEDDPSNVAESYYGPSSSNGEAPRKKSRWS